MKNWEKKIVLEYVFFKTFEIGIGRSSIHY